MIYSFSGPNCVGKTTLVNKLSELFSIKPDIESSRRVGEVFGLQDDNLDVTQLALFISDLDKLIKTKNNDICLLDRSMLDAIVFNTYFWKHKRISDKVYKYIVNRSISNLRYIDKFFYIEPEFPIISDNFRDTDKQFQDELTLIYRDIIKDYNIDVIKLSGSIEERVKQALSNIVDNKNYLTYNNEQLTKE